MIQTENINLLLSGEASMPWWASIEEARQRNLNLIRFNIVFPLKRLVGVINFSWSSNGGIIRKSIKLSHKIIRIMGIIRIAGII